MKRKRIVALVAVVGLAAVAAAAAFSVHAWHGRSAVRCEPAGTWMGTNNYGARFITSITPWGPDRKGLTSVTDGIKVTDWLGVGSVAETKQYGWAVKTAQNTYQSTIVAYGLDEDSNVVYIMVGSMTNVLTGPDTFDYWGTAAYYAPDQDPFGDEPPALACIPVDGTHRRVPMAPPCEL